MFINHQNVPKVWNACSYLEEGGLCSLKDIKVTMESLLLLASMEKLSKPDWLQNKCSFMAEYYPFHSLSSKSQNSGTLSGIQFEKCSGGVHFSLYD